MDIWKMSPSPSTRTLLSPSPFLLSLYLLSLILYQPWLFSFVLLELNLYKEMLCVCHPSLCHQKMKCTHLAVTKRKEVTDNGKDVKKMDSLHTGGKDVNLVQPLGKALKRFLNIIDRYRYRWYIYIDDIDDIDIEDIDIDMRLLCDPEFRYGAYI